MFYSNPLIAFFRLDDQENVLLISVWAFENCKVSLSGYLLHPFEHPHRIANHNIIKSISQFLQQGRNEMGFNFPLALETSGLHCLKPFEGRQFNRGNLQWSRCWWSQSQRKHNPVIIFLFA